jgi:hypothetical protein
MRPLNATTHFVAALAVTAAAVATAFAMPTTADAMTITIVGKDNGNMVVGSGKEVGTARKVAPFTTLRLEDSVDVSAHPGPNPGVVVHADDNIEPMIDTLVEGDALVVRLHKGTSFRTNRKIWVEVEFATLNASQQRGSGDLHVSTLNGSKFESSIAGSGDLQIDNVQLDSFAVSIRGSGDVKVAGHANEAHFKIDGSGDVSAGDLVAKRVEVSIAGSGDAHVNATEAIEARVAGSGDVTYSGHPHDVSRSVAGSGSVEAR